MPEVRDVLTDPKFHALPEPERLKVLRALDPKFAGLPDAEQLKVVATAAEPVSAAPAQSQPDEGMLGLAKRFLSGVRGTLPDSPLDYIRGPLEALRHPGQFLQNRGQAAGETAVATTGGRYTPGITEMLSAFYSLPGVVEATAPMVKATGLARKEKGAGGVAEGLGTVAGIGGQAYLLGKAPVGKAASTAKVALTRAQRTGSSIAQRIESAVFSSIPGASEGQRLRLKQNQQIINLADETAAKISSAAGASAEEVGMQTQAAIDTARTAARDAASQSFKVLDEAAQGVKVDLSKAQSVAKDLISQLDAVEELIPASKFGRTRELLSNLATLSEPQLVKDAAGNISKVRRLPRFDFEIVQAARSELLDISRGLNATAQPKAAGLARKFSGLLDDAMEGAAGASGNPDLLKAYRTANAQWREAAETFDRSVLGKVADVAPEKVHLVLRDTSLDNIRLARRAIPAPEWQSVKARIWRDLIEGAMTGEKAAAALPEGVASGLGVEAKTVGTKIGAQSLSSSLKRIGDARLKEIFSPAELEGIRSVEALAQRTSFTGSIVGKFFDAYLFGAAAKAGLTGDPLGMLQPAAVAVGLNVMARVIARPEGAEALARVARATSRQAGRAAAGGYWATRLNQIIQQEAEREAESPLQSTGLAPQPKQRQP